MDRRIASTADSVGLVFDPVSNRVDRVEVERADAAEAVHWQPDVWSILIRVDEKTSDRRPLTEEQKRFWS